MSLAVVTIGADELRAMISDAVEHAVIKASRQVAASIERVSAGRAASIAKKRRSVVLGACESGALTARRDGVRWSIRVSDLDAWCAAGFPEALRP
jgi:hypothetical protein